MKDHLSIFINGLPGAGKTTIAKLLCSEYNFEYVSTGDVLRVNITTETPLGRIAKDYINRKELVPDQIVIDMVVEKIRSCDSIDVEGWVLDGFPRTGDQVNALKQKSIVPLHVVILELPEATAVRRLLDRRFDPVTGNIYNSPLILPQDSMIRSRLTKRSDDTVDKIRPRMDAYKFYGECTNAMFSASPLRVNVGETLPLELTKEISDLLQLAKSHTQNNIKTNITQSMKPHSKSLSLNSSSSSSRYSMTKIPNFKGIQEEAADEMESDDDDDDAVRFEREYTESMTESIKSLPISDNNGVPQVDSDICTTKSADQENSVKSSDGDESRRLTRRSLSSITSSNNNNNEQSSRPTRSMSIHATSNVTLMRSNSSNEHLTSDEMEKFKELLLDGFEVLKHGRRGSPHVRLVFTDMDFKRIFWQKPCKEIKTKKPKLDQSLNLKDVVQVVRGMKTEVLKRSGNVINYEKYLALVADDRTLDMEVASEDMCEFLLKGFEQMLQY